jgi:hypothetical protein
VLELTVLKVSVFKAASGEITLPEQNVFQFTIANRVTSGRFDEGSLAGIIVNSRKRHKRRKSQAEKISRKGAKMVKGLP